MKTSHGSGFLLLLFALGPTSSLAQAPQTQAPQSPSVPVNTTPVINFVTQIDNGSVSVLISIVNQQMRGGATKLKILISSSGGDTASAFAAYNYLHNLPIQVTTFNVGTVDSAAMLLFCGGRERYALPGTRFLIHGNSLTVPPGMPMNAAALDAQLQQIKSLNQMIVQVVSATTDSKMRSSVENAVRDQIILTAEEAKNWGLVQNIRPNFMDAGDLMVALPPSTAPEKKTVPPLIPSTDHFNPVAGSKP